MKKTFPLLALALLLLGPFFLSGCSDDDVIERPDYTMVKYHLALGPGWLKLYDVTVDYLTADGQSRKAELKEDVWEYTDRVDGQYKRFKFVVTARAKKKTLDPNDASDIELIRNSHDLTYSYEYYYYEKESSAHTIKKKDEGRTLGPGEAASYLQEHPTQELLNHTITLK